MAIKTLTGVTKIGGFDVLEIQERISADDYAKALEEGKFVCVNHKAHSISFTLQDGPRKAGGVNGCQVDTILEAAAKIIEGLNMAPHNCMENEKAILHIKEALLWLDKRSRDREKRGVEGTNTP